MRTLAALIIASFTTSSAIAGSVSAQHFPNWVSFPTKPVVTNSYVKTDKAVKPTAKQARKVPKKRLKKN